MRNRFLLLALIALCGCNNYDMPDTHIKSYGEFFAGINTSPDSKVNVNPEGKVKWDDKDTISVFSDVSTPMSFVRNNETELFKGNAISGSKFFGYFPYSADAYDKTNPMVLRLSSPEVAFDGKQIKAPMIAKSEDNHLQFRQTCGAIYFNITSSVRYDALAFFGNDGEFICGKGHIDLNSDSPVFELDDEGKEKEILSIFPEDVSFTDGVGVYIFLPELEFKKGFTLVLYRFNGDELAAIETKACTVPCKIDRGKSARYEVNMDSTIVPPASIIINKPEGDYRCSAQCSAFCLDDLGASGYINGRPLNIRFSTINSSWITLYEDNSGRLMAGIQGNTMLAPRVGSIYIDYCNGSIPIHREYYKVIQSSFMMRLDFQSNKGDFPYWKNYDTNGYNVVFFSPYPSSQYGGVLRSNDLNIGHVTTRLYDQDTVTSYRQYADSDVPSDWVIEPTDNAGTGYDYNFKLLFTYTANRNFDQDLVEYDMDDVCNRGLYRLTRHTFFPMIYLCLDWPSFNPKLEPSKQSESICRWTYLYKDYEKTTPVSESVYTLQTFIVMYNITDWWHLASPIGKFTNDIDNYEQTFVLDENEKCQFGDYFVSNMEWDLNDLEFSNPGWPFLTYLGETTGTPTGGNVTGAELFFFANTYVTETHGQEFRNAKHYPSRSSDIAVLIDMKDGKAPIRWPVANMWQPGIPVIEYTKFTWNGTWVDTYEVSGNSIYTKKTRGYWYLSVSNTDVSGYQATGTDKYNGQYIPKGWEDSHYDGRGYSRVLLTDGSTSFDGYQDYRVVYPNGTMVYAMNGPYFFSTVGAPVEPDPIPAAMRKSSRRHAPSAKHHSADRHDIIECEPCRLLEGEPFQGAGEGQEIKPLSYSR